MTTTPDAEPLGGQLRHLALWADRVPPHARTQAGAAVDRLAVTLGELVADTRPTSKETPT